MRTLFSSIVSLVVMLVIGCNTVDPDECWPNTSGGFGGGGPIPIGAGVGATTSGDFISPPPGGPLAATATENPCVAMGSITIVAFSPSEFPFVTIVQDDGTGPAGGYQEARANLEFIKKRRGGASTWYCSLTIKMPLRTEFMGKISASRAADLSVEITEAVAENMDYNLPPGVFCIDFVPKVDAAFKSKYPLLGATATK
jgi:hypothetical protein